MVYRVLLTCSCLGTFGGLSHLQSTHRYPIFVLRLSKAC